jgi:hypothetical protein
MMKAKNDGKHVPDDDFGLEDKVKEYHRHGGSQGGDYAKALEGEISSASARHDGDLKKARPDISAVRPK